jgi:hypothetical protein
MSASVPEPDACALEWRQSGRSADIARPDQGSSFRARSLHSASTRPPRQPVAVPKAPRGRTSGRRPRLRVALLPLLHVGVSDQVGEEVRTVSWTRPYGAAPRSSPILPRLLDRARCGGRVRAGAYVGRRAAIYPGRGGILCPSKSEHLVRGPRFLLGEPAAIQAGLCRDVHSTNLLANQVSSLAAKVWCAMSSK